MVAPHEHGLSAAAQESRTAAWDRWAFAIAFSAWVAATVATCFYVALYSTPIPAVDDLELVPLIDPGTPLGWTFLWSHANEHRILLARLVYYALLALTHDFRSGMYFQVFVQSALALCLILFVRRLRGRSSFSDAFFPLLLLNWGDSGNLLLGVQMATSIATALVCAFVMLAMRRPGPPSRSTALAMTACILLLPLDGGFGLMQVPALGLWIAVSAWYLLRGNDAGSKKSGRALAGGLILLAGVVAFYFVDFSFPPAIPRTSNPIVVLRTALQFLSINFGPAAETWRTSAQILAVAFAGAAVWAALRSWPRREERWRAAAVLAGLAASCTIALSIGVSRGALREDSGLSNRYVILPAPFLVTAYLGLSLFAPRWLELTAQGVMCVAFLAVQPINFDSGAHYGVLHRNLGHNLIESMHAGRSIEQFARVTGNGFYPDPDGLCARFEALRRAHYPPFLDVAEDPEWGGIDEYCMFNPRPRSVVSSKTTSVRNVYDGLALTVCSDSTIVLEPPAGTRELQASYGLLPILWEGKYTKDAHSDGVRVGVEWRAQGAEPRVLFERELQPHLREEDRGVQSLRVAIPEERPGELVLTTRHLSDAHRQLDWSFWRDVAAR